MPSCCPGLTELIGARYNRESGLMEAKRGEQIQCRVLGASDDTRPESIVTLTFAADFKWSPTWDGPDAMQEMPQFKEADFVSITEPLEAPERGWWDEQAKEQLRSDGLTTFMIYKRDRYLKLKVVELSEMSAP